MRVRTICGAILFTAVFLAVQIDAADTKVDLSKEQVGKPPATFEPIVVMRVPASEIELVKLSFGGLRIGSLTQTRLRLTAPDSTLLRSLKPSMAI